MLLTNGTLVFPDRVAPGWLQTHAGRITVIGGSDVTPPDDDEVIDLQGDYLTPGFVDLHVHGGAGHDFMDGTEEAFRAVCAAHLRHGTTSLTPTTTVASH